MEDQVILIRYVVAWTLVGAIIFTTIATCASLVGWIKFASRKQQNALFAILIVELMGGSVAFFLDLIRIAPDQAAIELGSRAVANFNAGINVNQPSPVNVSPLNPAHNSLWFFTKWHLDKRDMSFSEMAGMSLEQINISHFTPGDSQTIRQNKAKGSAELYDNTFKSLFSAEYETDTDHAINAMYTVLVDPVASFGDLATVVDANYRFKGQ